MNQTCHFDHVVDCEVCEGAGEVECVVGECDSEWQQCPNVKCDGGKVIKSWVDCDCDECQDSYFVVDANTEEYVSRHKNQLPAVIEATQYAAKNNASSYVFSGDSIYYRAFGDGDYAYDIFQGQLEPMVRRTQSAA